MASAAAPGTQALFSALIFCRLNNDVSTLQRHDRILSARNIHIRISHSSSAGRSKKIEILGLTKFQFFFVSLVELKLFIYFVCIYIYIRIQVSREQLISKIRSEKRAR